jgi:hypothetical protein
MKVIVKIIPNLFGIGERDREVASSAIWQAKPGRIFNNLASHTGCCTSFQDVLRRFGQYGHKK